MNPGGILLKDNLPDERLTDNRVIENKIQLYTSKLGTHMQANIEYIKVYIFSSKYMITLYYFITFSL